MTPTSELAQTWLADPEALAHDALRELSDAQWSALTLRLVESLPSSGSDGDEQVRLLVGLRRLVGLRGPLPDQPALLAMRQRYVVRLAHAEPDGGPVTKAVDALTASSPSPPATFAPVEPKVDPKPKPGRPRFDEDVIEHWREDKLETLHDYRFFRERLTDDHSYANNPMRRETPTVEPTRTNQPNPPRQFKKKPESGKSKPRRWLVNVEGQDRVNSLKVGTDYVVSFAVGTKSEPHVASGHYAQRAHRGRGTLDLTVQLSSTDFDIRSDPLQPLAVPQTGPSPAPARYLVGARHSGECTLTAAVHCDGNFVTLLHFTVVVGNSRPATLTVVGRPPEGLSTLEPRDISLTLERIDAGYKCHIVADGKSAPPAYLTITPEALSMEVDALQNSLLDVVRTLDDHGTEVFQVGLQIPRAQERAALRTMAHAGERLFRELFFGEQSGVDSHKLGNYLREAANDEGALLTLQVVDNQAPIPWALLYVGDVDDLARLDWHKFLGLRHLIEQVPLAPLSARQPRGITSKPRALRWTQHQPPDHRKPVGRGRRSPGAVEIVDQAAHPLGGLHAQLPSGRGRVSRGQEERRPDRLLLLSCQVCRDRRRHRQGHNNDGAQQALDSQRP